MIKLFTVVTLVSILAISCKQNVEPTKNAESETTEKSTDHTNYLVHTTNKAWANAEELNKRVSPPETVMAETTNGLKMAIHFSSPFVKNRTVWDSLVPYEQVWRTGANEATVVEFSEDVIIENNTVEKGAYSLFTIPTENEFTIILNAVADQWGAYEYDESKDVVRFTVKSVDKDFSESLSFMLEMENNQIKSSFGWGNKGFEFNVLKAN
ncbi:MAG: DUF2911 domain-containing protein [Bacteroidia bacterium]